MVSELEVREGTQSSEKSGALAEGVFNVGSAKFALYNEDCIEGMKKRIAPGSVDIVVTSPPYNLGIQYATYDDTIARHDYLAWLGRWAEAVKAVLSDSGSVFLNIGSKPSDPWVPFEVVMEMRKHFALQNVIHWVKSIAIEKADVGDYPGITRNIAVGHYKPINSDRYLNDCQEYVFHLTKTGDVPLDRLSIGVEYQDKSNIGRWKSAAADKRCRGNTWFVPYKTIKSRDEDRPHPATFPVELAKKCVLLHGLDRVQKVMDPLLGIGHAGVAAALLQKDFIGFEIDAHYFAEALKFIRSAEVKPSATWIQRKGGQQKELTAV